MRSTFTIFANLWLLAAAIASDYAQPQARIKATDLRGLYVGSNDVATDSSESLAAALKVPGVDGLLLIIGWNEIEPSKGGYRWDALDQWMHRADSLGRNVTLSIRAGTKTPSWLFQPAPSGVGVKKLGFSIARKSGAKGACEPDTIAAPWDTAFQAQWDSMLASLAAHLKSVGSYGTLTTLRLTGINRDTDELHLPAETAQSTGLDCVSNAITIWQDAGYRPSRLLQGWDAITSSFQKHFPDKYFSVAIIAVTSPFPPIAEDGSAFTVTNHESLSVSQNLPLLTLASQKFPGHLVIQNNTLYVTEPAQPQTIHAAQSLGTMIAFQTNEDLPPNNDKRAACGARGDTTACTAVTYLELLERGIFPLGKDSTMRAQYIEVFAANATAFPDDILLAHAELLAPNQTTVQLSDPTIPSSFEVRQNYPNPFNPTTVISYSVPSQMGRDLVPTTGRDGQLPVFSPVRLVVYDLLGREVAVLVNERKAPGSYSVEFNADGLASGTYIYRLTAGSFRQSRRMLLLK